MGLLDWLTGGEDAQVKKHVKRMANLNAQTEDREFSAHWLAEHGTDEAIIGMLGRFNITLESRMKDAKEKELVYDLVAGLGHKATGPVRAWVRANQNFAQPLRLLQDIEGEGAVVEVLLEMLAAENDPIKTEKKRQILIRLAEHIDDRICEGVAPHIADFDEGVRYAAAEALIAQDDPAVPGLLAAALANPEEESNRLRVRIAEAFNLRRWPLGDVAGAVAANPPLGWRVAGDQLIRG